MPAALFWPSPLKWQSVHCILKPFKPFGAAFIAALVTHSKPSTGTLDPMSTSIVKACLPSLCPLIVDIVNTSITTGSAWWLLRLWQKKIDDVVLPIDSFSIYSSTKLINLCVVLDSISILRISTEIQNNCACLICQDTVSIFKEYNVKRYYQLKDANMYDSAKREGTQQII